MSLSHKLNSVSLAYACPHCATIRTKRGDWFRTILVFRCVGCAREVHMTYDAKLKLFSDYEAAQAKLP
jgi:hypothetical protein